MAASYPIAVVVDPSGVTTGSAKVKQELSGVETAAASAKRSMDAAFTGASGTIDKVAESTDGLNKSLNEMSSAAATSLTGSNDNAASLETLATQTDKVALATGEATKAKREHAAANENDTASAGRNTTAQIVLQSAIRKTTDQFAAGAPVSQIFGEHIETLIEVLELYAQGAARKADDANEGVGKSLSETGEKVVESAEKFKGLKGFAGEAAEFLAGPWGIAVALAGSALTALIPKLFETDEAAQKAADEGLLAFEKRQQSLARFVDLTTGRLIEQNRTLALVQQQQGRFQLQTANNETQGNVNAAFGAVRDFIDKAPRSLDVSKIVTANLTAKTAEDLNRQIAAAAQGNAAFDELSKTVAGYFGKAVEGTEKIRQLTGDQLALNTALNHGTILTSKSVETLVNQATATDAVTRAQVKLDALKAKADDLDKQPYSPAQQAALQQNATAQIAATKAVEGARQAEEDDRKALTAANEERRKAIALAKERANTAREEANFVKAVEDASAVKGEKDPAEQLQAQITQKLNEYKSRFKVDATPEYAGRITTALTGAQARDQQQAFDTAYVYPLRTLDALQGQVGLSRQIMNAELTESVRLYGPATAGQNKLTDAQKATIETSLRSADARNREVTILQQVRGPLEEYRAEVEALNRLLATGAINQTQYNARVAQLGQSARQTIAGLPGADSRGRNLSDIAGRANADASYRKTLGDIDSLDGQRDASGQSELDKIGVSRRDADLAAERKHTQDLRDVATARKNMQIDAAQSTADSLLSIAETTAGKNSAVYKAAFAVDKAVAIAKSIVAIQTGIAEAAANPFPENLGAIASVVAATASIVSNIQSVALNLADGGYVSGPGSSRSDSIPANLSNGEFVVNAGATAQNRALLEAVNSGQMVASARRSANDNGVATGGGDSYAFSFGNVVVQAPAGADPQTTGKAVKDQLRALVDERIRAAKRPGGALTTIRKSGMVG